MAKGRCFYVVAIIKKSPGHFKYTFENRLQNLALFVIENLDFIDSKDTVLYKVTMKECEEKETYFVTGDINVSIPKSDTIHFKTLDVMNFSEVKNNASGIKFNKGSRCLEFETYPCKRILLIGCKRSGRIPLEMRRNI